MNDGRLTFQDPATLEIRAWEAPSATRHGQVPLESQGALQRINQDILGAYFFREPRVKLFWVPIGIVSRLLQVPVEALTL